MFQGASSARCTSDALATSRSPNGAGNRVHGTPLPDTSGRTALHRCCGIGALRTLARRPANLAAADRIPLRSRGGSGGSREEGSIMNRIARLNCIVSLGTLLAGLGACTAEPRVGAAEPLLLGNAALALLANDVFG